MAVPLRASPFGNQHNNFIKPSTLLQFLAVDSRRYQCLHAIVFNGGIGNQWNKAIGTAIGYRIFDVDYEDDGFVYDARQQGWQLGLIWAFQERHGMNDMQTGTKHGFPAHWGARSFAGDNDRPDISNTFMQPFAAYTWQSGWTASAQSESSYNWETEQWSVPVNGALAKLVMFGKVPVSLQGGVGYWMESPDNGPEGLRFRLQANIVLPR